MQTLLPSGIAAPFHIACLAMAQGCGLSCPGAVPLTTWPSSCHLVPSATGGYRWLTPLLVPAPLPSRLWHHLLHPALCLPPGVHQLLQGSQLPGCPLGPDARPGRHPAPGCCPGECATAARRLAPHFNHSTRLQDEAEFLAACQGLCRRHRVHCRPDCSANSARACQTLVSTRLACHPDHPPCCPPPPLADAQAPAHRRCHVQLHGERPLRLG